MSNQEYKYKYDFLQDVLKDALERGDYFLEFDTIEKIEQLNLEYYGEENED